VAQASATPRGADRTRRTIELRKPNRKDAHGKAGSLTPIFPSADITDSEGGETAPEETRAKVIQKPALRQWSRREEIANGASHGLGFLAVMAATPFLMSTAVRHGGMGRVFGAGIFAVSCMFLYLSSALVHGLAAERSKRFFEVLDHAGIFLLIAGTYTPFALGVLWGPWGWLVLSVIWPLAICGVLVTTVRGVPPFRITTALYLGMGWFMLCVLKPLSMRVPARCLFLLLAGGLAYTAGLLFYVARRVPYHHLAWHLAVLAGTTCHFVAVWQYAI
jgi:hemolysin III